MKQEDSQNVVEIIVNFYIWIFKKNKPAPKPTTPHFVVSLI